MSSISITGGLIHYWQSHHLKALHDRYLPKLHSRVAFERFYRWLVCRSQEIIAGIDTVSLQRYMVLLIGSVLVLCGWAYVTAARAPLGGPLAGSSPDVIALAGLVALVIGSVGATILHRRRLTAVVFLSTVGLVVSLAFVRFSAPDLALTQLAVEVVTITLLLLALRFVPPEAVETAISAVARHWIGHRGRCKVAAPATRCSTGMTFRLLPANAVPGGGGTNVSIISLTSAPSTRSARSPC